MKIKMFGRSLVISVVILCVPSATSLPLSGAAQPVQQAPVEVAQASECTPKIALVFPEFVVASGKEVTFTLIGSCLNMAGNLQLSAGSRGDKLVKLKPGKGNARMKKFSGSFDTADPKGTYSFCLPDDKGQCQSLQAPTVVTVSDSVCSDPGIPTESSPSLQDLRSEMIIEPDEPPGGSGHGRCVLGPAHARQAVIVDAETGLSCRATNLSAPDDGCLVSTAEKTTIDAPQGGSVRLYLVNKDPFLESYQLAITPSNIKDDDIGTFLGMLVPGLSGTSPKQASITPAAASTAAAAGTADIKQKLMDSSNVINGLTDEIKSETFASTKFASASRDIQRVGNIQDQVERTLDDETAFVHPGKEPELKDNIKSSEESKGDLDRLTSMKQPKKADFEKMAEFLTERQKYLQKGLDLVQTAKDLDPAGKTNACVQALGSRLTNLITNYAFFAAEYNRERNYLLTQGAKCTDLSDTAVDLWRLASLENAKISDSRIDINFADAIRAVNLFPPPSDVPARGGASDPKGVPGSHKAPTADQILLNSDLTSLNADICTLTALRSQIGKVLTTNITGIESVLTNPNAFRSQILIGPYADPTQVDWTVQRTMVKSPLQTMDSTIFATALDGCLSKSAPPAPQPKQGGPSNPQSARLRAPSVKRTAPMLLSAALPFAASPEGGSPQKSKANNPQTPGNSPTPPDNPPQDTSTIQGTRINFGSERFIVSAGAAFAWVVNRQFAKGVGQATDAHGNPISGQETANIITLSTDQPYRIRPVVFVNTRVHQWKRSSEALYATFGITASSNSNGVNPEYMLAASQSFARRHFLFSAGLYLAQTQALTGGLRINQAIPSTLTGNIPTRNDYKPGFGVSVSWRIPGLAKVAQ